MFTAVAGGSPAQTSSTSRSTVTDLSAGERQPGETARCRGPPRDAGSPSRSAVIGPSNPDVERAGALVLPVRLAPPHRPGTLRANVPRGPTSTSGRSGTLASVAHVASQHFRAGRGRRRAARRRPGAGVRAGRRRRAAGSSRRAGSSAARAPLDAAWRELARRPGSGPTTSTLVGEHPEWIVYEWPPERRRRRGPTRPGPPLVLRSGLRRRRRRRRPDGSEFSGWRWVDAAWLIDHVVDVPARRRTRRCSARGRDERPVRGGAPRSGCAAQAPLAARLRPRTIDDVVGQEHLVGPGRPLRRLVEQDRLTSALFWGPPGTGKTTLALAVAGTTARAFEQMSAVTAGVKDVREVIERARQRLGERGQGTILFLDEIHRFTKSQQDALLPAVEDGTLTLIGATTENPFFEVNPPLRSRSTLFRLEPLDRRDLRDARRPRARGRGHDRRRRRDRPARRARRRRRPAGADLARGRVRARPPRRRSTLEHVEAALGTSALRYGRDDHYDVISAFIKSMRGSDPDAAVYWLARMLEAGEDARFIARRMVIFASEDVGMADPQALLVAVAAAHAVEHVGLPEAQLNLSQAVIHLATAPKSNRSALAIWNARADVAAGAVGEVPAHLRDGHYQGAAVLGHGAGYDYPHDHDREGWVAQQYLPDALADRTLVRAERPRVRTGDRRAHETDTGARSGGRAMTAGELASSSAARAVRDRFAALIVVLVRVLDTLKVVARRGRCRCAPRRAAAGRAAQHRRGGATRRRGAARPRALRPRARLGRGDQRRGRGQRPVARTALSAPMIKAAGLATGTSRVRRRERLDGRDGARDGMMRASRRGSSAVSSPAPPVPATPRGRSSARPPHSWRRRTSPSRRGRGPRAGPATSSARPRGACGDARQASDELRAELRRRLHRALDDRLDPGDAAARRRPAGRLGRVIVLMRRPDAAGVTAQRCVAAATLVADLRRALDADRVRDGADRARRCTAATRRTWRASRGRRVLPDDHGRGAGVRADRRPPRRAVRRPRLRYRAGRRCRAARRRGRDRRRRR